MTEHEIHVTGYGAFGGFGVEMELRCTAEAGAQCRMVTNAWGEDPEPVDQCNAIEWWEGVGPEDLIHGHLPGPPPWPVVITWTDDGPEIRAAGGQP